MKVKQQFQTNKRMVATCQKNSHGKNKILHHQQKNQEILFVSQRKLTF